MTISSTTRKAGPFLGNGSTTGFPFAFKVFKKNDVTVTLTDASGTDSVLVLDSDYTIVLNADQDANPGGVVTYPRVGAPMPAGFRLTLTGGLSYSQPTDIQNSGGFYPQVVEDMSDRSTIQIQQLAEQLARALKFSVSDIGANTVLPPADLRASKVLGFDSDGSPTVVVPASGSAAEVALALQSFINALANNTLDYKGAALVGYKPLTGAGTTAFSALRGLDAGVASLQGDVAQLISDVGDLDSAARDSTLQSLDAGVIDMHFGTLRGLGWNSAETVNTEFVTSTTAAVPVRSLSIPVVSASGFVTPQLIVYRGIDNEYYTATVVSKSGNTLNLGEETDAAIASGGLVANAYRDDAHPNQWGAYAIADDTLRRLSHVEELAAVQRNYMELSVISGATIAGDTEFSYANPGATTDVSQRAAKVTAPTTNSGASSRPLAIPAGTYRVTFPIRVAGKVSVQLQEWSKEGESRIIGSLVLVGDGSVRLASIMASVRPGSALAVIVLNATAAATVFSIGRISFFRITGRAPSLNRGVIELFGDSWINGGYITLRMRQRLPKATIIQSGVGGNNMQDLLARFETDVIPNKPDWVFVMCGTNDVYQGTLAKAFETDALVLKSRIKSIGARPVFWNCSVCYKDYVGGDRLSESRRFAIQVDYGEQAPIVKWQGSQQETAAFMVKDVTVGAGLTVNIAAIPAQVTRAVRLNSYLGSTAGLTVALGYGPTIDAITLTETVTWASDAPARDLVAPKSNAFPSAACVTLTNATGGAIVLTCSFELAWYRD